MGAKKSAPLAWIYGPVALFDVSDVLFGADAALVL
jgi:hypothetical protein